MQSAKRAARPTVSQRTEAVCALTVEDKDALTLELRRYLKDRSSRVRWAALDVVKDEALSELEPHVVELLSDKNLLVRDIAVECLGTLHEGEGISAPWLYPLLEDKEWLVWVETIESLAQIGDESSRPLIAKLLRDNVALVRGYAATHLVLLGASDHRDEIEHAASIESEEGAQVRFASALFDLGDKEQFATVLKFLSSSSYSVRCAAANILADLDLDSDQLDSALRAVAYAHVNYLYRGDQSTMETVEKALQESVV